MYELPVSSEEYKKQQEMQEKLLDPWRGGPLHEGRSFVSTEDKMLADQSNYQGPNEDQVKVINAKKLLQRALEYVEPFRDPFANDEGYKAYSLINDINKFIKDA